MRSRAFRIFLLALVGVWYAAVLPGHTRGVVQLPGSGGDSCCDHDGPHSPDAPAKAPTSPRTCAVCFHMAALTPAAPPDLGIAPLGLTEHRPALIAPTPVSIRPLPTYLGRGPPATA